jgi:hypothetical protein
VLRNAVKISKPSENLLNNICRINYIQKEKKTIEGKRL